MSFQGKALIVCLYVFLLSGCMTPPRNYIFESSREYKSSFDEVWENIISYMASNNIKIKNIEKDSGVIYAESTSFIDAFADCGGSGIWTKQGRVASFNIFVRKVKSNPVVYVNTEFHEIRVFDRQQQAFKCNSTGLLEQNILSSI